MIREAIILAGGLGTRLQGVLSDLPKPMAPVNSKPFLCYLFEYLSRYGINRVILSVGYKHEAIKACFSDSYKGIELDYAVEETPLGTGGGIAYASKLAKSTEVFLLNGDSFFDVDLSTLYSFHQTHKAQLTLSLKPMQRFDRYGAVTVQNNRISQFKSKEFVESGQINGGVYVLNTAIFKQIAFPERFSFETDLMEHHLQDFQIFGFISDGYFIDIGIPEDYYRADKEFARLFGG